NSSGYYDGFLAWTRIWYRWHTSRDWISHCRWNCCKGKMQGLAANPFSKRGRSAASGTSHWNTRLAWLPSLKRADLFRTARSWKVGPMSSEQDPSAPLPTTWLAQKRSPDCMTARAG